MMDMWPYVALIVAVLYLLTVIDVVKRDDY